jgi:hypothetical protein
MPEPIEKQTDVFGRKFDAAKFLPRFDRLRRWVNARGGRRGKNAGKAPFPAKAIAAMKSPNESETPEKPETPATPAPGTGPEKTPAAAMPPPPPAPSLADIEAAANREAPPPEAEAEPAPEAEPATTAETLIGIIQTALVLIGEQEGVLNDTEKTLLRQPLERVLRKYDIGDDVLPPEVDFAVALAGIVIVRLKKPRTATFAAKVKAWVASKWHARRGAKMARQVAAATARPKEGDAA